MTNRYVVVGCGAVGGSIGGLLHLSGHRVHFVARGPHGQRIRERGLRLRTPDSDQRLDVPSSATVPDLTSSDVVILGTKLQDAAAALDAIRRATRAELPVVCAQNGLSGEAMAAQRGFLPIGMMVWLPATHLEPGEVRLHAANPRGVLDVGDWPSGAGAVCSRLAESLTTAGFDSRAVPDVMAAKRAKLLTNIKGVAYAAIQQPDAALLGALEREGRAVFDALGLPVLKAEALAARVAHIDCLDIGGQPREGGSAWQSLMRGKRSEVDFLCGEIVRLGRLVGVKTPTNRRLQQAVHRLIHDGSRPRSLRDLP